MRTRTCSYLEKLQKLTLKLSILYPSYKEIALMQVIVYIQYVNGFTTQVTCYKICIYADSDAHYLLEKMTVECKQGLNAGCRD